MQRSTVPADAFAALEHCCYIKPATSEGRQGWVLIDSDGEFELFTENRSDVFFYAAKHELTVVMTN